MEQERCKFFFKQKLEEMLYSERTHWNSSKAVINNTFLLSVLGTLAILQIGKPMKNISDISVFCKTQPPLLFHHIHYGI